MDEKRLEREAEKQRLKEQFLADLRARKAFKAKAEAAAREARLADALYGVNQRLEELTRLSETTDEMTARLRSQSALVDAKLDIALENRVADSPGFQPGMPEARASEKTLGDQAQPIAPPSSAKTSSIKT
ncbi:MAG: hypothetical protein RMM53_05010, partial [Bacteroidia bacterium]|nr:hypothetical protein [Bacteroidia bacterium]MDW8333558.1 hypothetical protein [Bacteroidia bacterium]